MPLNARALDGMAAWLAGAAPYLALHSADPGPDGLDETSAVRVPADWPAPVNGDLLVLDKAFHGGAANGPISHVGLWSAPVGGLFYGSGELSGDLRFNAIGAYHIASLTINGAS
jgi:hypothetical protein